MKTSDSGLNGHAGINCITAKTGRHRKLERSPTSIAQRQQLGRLRTSGPGEKPVKASRQLPGLRVDPARGRNWVVYRACWTKGRHDRYPYYLCRTKICASYGKSINRDVIESEFEGLLRALKPKAEFYEIASELFRELWDARVAASHSNRVHLLDEVKRIENQIEQLVDRIVSAQSQTVLSAYENRLSSLEARKAEVTEMIENCGRPLIDFDTTHRTALQFLENPYLTWD